MLKYVVYLVVCQGVAPPCLIKKSQGDYNHTLALDVAWGGLEPPTSGL